MQNILSYKIAMFLFIFGLVGSAFASTGMFETPIPVNAPEDNSDYYETIGDEISETGSIGIFTTVELLLTCVGVLIGALVSVFTVLPLLTSLGVPVVFGMIIQAPIWLVYAKDLYTIVTGN